MPSNLIRRVRISKNISKKRLASDLMAKPSRVTALENGANGTPDEYAILALSLDQPIDELYPNQERDWPEIEKKRKMIEMQRQIDLKEFQMQTEEQERLSKEIAKKRSERDKDRQKIKKNHEGS